MRTKIQRFLNKGKNTSECALSGKNVSIKQLIGETFVATEFEINKEGHPSLKEAREIYIHNTIQVHPPHTPAVPIEEMNTLVKNLGMLPFSIIHRIN